MPAARGARARSQARPPAGRWSRGRAGSVFARPAFLRCFPPPSSGAPRLSLTALCCAGLAGPLFAQGGWVTPQPPCELSAGHFKVNGGILYLKTAAEKPERRDQPLEQARKGLTEAIAPKAQDKNAAPWYYLGPYY